MEDMTEDNIQSVSHLVSMSIFDFQQEITYYLNLLENAHAELLDVYEVFEVENHIWPDQLRDFNAFLRKMYEPIRELCKLLEKTSSSPEAVVSGRYLLLMSLQNAEEQVLKLIPLVSSLLDESLPSAKRRRRQEREVKNLFVSLKRSYDDMLSHGRSLMDQIGLQRRKYDYLLHDQKRLILLQNATSYEKLGRDSSESGQKEYARECFERALTLVKRADDREKEASILNDLGLVYVDIGSYTKARNCLEQALDFYREAGDQAGAGRINNALGTVYRRLGQKKSDTER